MHSQLEKHKNMNKNLLSFLDGAKLACVKDNKAPIAQLVEQRTLNPWVTGSIPVGGTFLGGNVLPR